MSERFLVSAEWIAGRVAEAVAQERERCAELADEYYADAMRALREDKAEARGDWDPHSYGAGFKSGEACAASEIGHAIRARREATAADQDSAVADTTPASQEQGA